MDLLSEVQVVPERPEGNSSMAELLVTRFRELYPHIPIGRPGRFLETVRRIEAPVRGGTLKGSDRKSYLKRKWAPRIRNTTAQGKI
jgi:hypothetical protein